MKSKNGKDMLLYISDDGDFREHIESLHMISKLDFNKIIPSHGDIMTDSQRIKEAIFDRIYYLTKVNESKGELELKDCLKKDINNYESLKYHKYNIEQLV